MTLEDYQAAIQQFVRYPARNERQYLALGLVGEVGEVSSKFAKRLRGDDVPDADVLKEISDVLWFARMIRAYFKSDHVATVKTLRLRHVDHAVKVMFDCAAAIYGDMQQNTVAPINLCLLEDCIDYIARQHGAKNLEAVADINYRKLLDRQQRGVIQGDGDQR